jgi:hypothetical protein
MALFKKKAVTPEPKVVEKIVERIIKVEVPVEVKVEAPKSIDEVQDIKEQPLMDKLLAEFKERTIYPIETKESSKIDLIGMDTASRFIHVVEFSEGIPSDDQLHKFKALVVSWNKPDVLSYVAFLKDDKIVKIYV